ncbi:uncharacterized protein C11orf42-like [Antedon mediterranea]|uniref:uncharacterized protein C11orf42-like n=1 Tax=Antedon mediterranea TaxID=105859 RepID=UPI003AF6082E
MMDLDMYSAITACDNRLVWSLIRDEVGNELLGKDIVPVPSILEAQQFEILTLFVKKKRSLLSRLLRRERPKFKILGPLEQFLDHKRRDSKSIMNRMTALVKSAQVFTRDYFYRRSQMVEGVSKSIQLSVKETNKFISPLTASYGELVLDITNPRLKGIRKVYLISEVCYARYMDLMTCYNSEEDYKDCQKGTPVGFCYVKIPMAADGTIGPVKECVQLTQNDQVDWIYETNNNRTHTATTFEEMEV